MKKFKKSMYLQLVQEALNNAQEGRTAILIAHRLSTVSKFPNSDPNP